MNIMPGNKTPTENELTSGMNGLKIKKIRDMTREERAGLVRNSCMPIIIELQDQSKIYAFVPQVHIGLIASQNMKN